MKYFLATIFLSVNAYSFLFSNNILNKKVLSSVRYENNDSENYLNSLNNTNFLTIDEIRNLIRKNIDPNFEVA